MAYVSKELKAKIAAKIKTIMLDKGFRYSISVGHQSTIILTIQSGPIDFIKEYNAAKAGTFNGCGDPFRPLTTNMEINEWDRNGNVFKGDTFSLIEDLWEALHIDHYDKSDSQSDCFNVGHYVKFKVGRWDKPYQLKLAEPVVASGG